MLYSARQECVARALNRHAASLFHVNTCIFPWDKTGLTMGKPEVNPTNNKVRVLGTLLPNFDLILLVVL